MQLCRDSLTVACVVCSEWTCTHAIVPFDLLFPGDMSMKLAVVSHHANVIMLALPVDLECI